MAIEELRNPRFSTVLDTWAALRGTAFAPPWRVADMLRYPPAVIPFITVVDIAPDAGDLRYRYWGTGHVDVKGVDFTGRSPAEHEPREYGRMIEDEYRRVQVARRPLAFVHDIRPGPGRVSKFQETLRLPISDDGKTVTGVISFADWDTDAEYWSGMFEKLTEAGPT